MKRWLSVLLLLVLCLSLCACGKKIVWDDVILSDMLPDPPTDKGEIHTNSADDLWMEIKKVSDKQFNDYIEACKEKGFTVDAESNSSSYDAHNAEGYKLSLGHYGSDADMTISLEAPIKLTTITWPESIAGKQLPTPKSSIGKFSYEHEDGFSVYVGDTTKADYAEYVAACAEKGFTVDYSKDENYYYADNSEGWHISVSYEGYNIMSIDIDAPSNSSQQTAAPEATEEPEEETNVPVNTPEPEVTAPPVEVTAPPAKTPEPEIPEEEPELDVPEPDNNGIDPGFKAAMDSYEDFVDEYVAFMKKYNENPGNLSLLLDYADFTKKYMDFLEEFEKWEDEDMNAAETAYYIEVQTRVNQKLMEIV